VADPDVGPAGYQPVRLWSTAGRIGRLRLLAYLGVAFFALALLQFAIGILAGALGGGRFLAFLPVLFWVPYVAISFLSYVKRAHDMNWSGSLCILAIVPLVNLVFVFMPGSKSVNRFGAPPPPNPLTIKVLGLLFPVGIVLIGILAAIAIPQYQSYVRRAQSVQGH
jgi:uncharacterized membrane protein YhaH (DUF805 family)